MSSKEHSAETSVGAGAAALPASPQQQIPRDLSQPPRGNPDFWGLIHRALRGRYVLATCLALMGGTIGAVTGWITAPRVFRSEGMVRIASSRPRVISETDQNKPIEMFDAFLQAQQAVMGSRKMIDVAMQDAAWKQIENDGQSRSPETFAASLKVEVRPRSDCMRIFFFDEDPATAAAGVRALINAYQGVYQREQDDFEQQRLELLQQRQAELAESVRRCERELGAAEPTAAKPEIEIDISPARELSVDEIAMRDPVMRKYLEEQSQREDQLAAARLSFGESHPDVRRARQALVRAQQKITQYAVQYRAYAPAAVKREAQLSTIDPARLRRLQDSADEAHKELAEVERRIQSLKTEGAVAGRLTVVTAGDVPSVPFQNSGKKMTALGGVAGAGLPVALLTMLGLVRRRYDRAMHAAEDFANVAPFFAIVPALRAKPNEDYLPAAHAIHRIRVKLQPRGQQESVTYLLTSASRGEGKTSAASALALSFTAAGHHTLLIDADFANRALTKAFKAESAKGLIEALSAGGTLEDVKRTRSGMSVLLSGKVENFQIGTLSVVALQRLIEEAREVFDVVVIDAGCVLDSPEALTIASEVDGVIGTVSRGQTPAQVQRMLQELRTVGATVAGMIFNRTDVKEFYSALHAAPAAVSKAAAMAATQVSQFGPLAAAVLHSMRLTHTEDTELCASDESAAATAAKSAAPAESKKPQTKGPVAA